MIKLKKIIACVLAIGMLFAKTESIVSASELETNLFDVNHAKGTIEEVFKAADEQDWEKFTTLMCSSEQKYYEYYFSETTINKGIKQIKNANLMNAYYIENELAKSEWLVEEYPILNENKEIYSFIAEVDCDVNNESKYFFDGINYFLIVMCVENDTLKVVQFNRPSSELISEIVKPKLLEESEVYGDQLAGIEVIEYAENGLVINASKKRLMEGFEIVTVENTNNENSLLSVEDFPILDHYSAYHYPTSIDVLMNDTENGGDNTIHTVKFDTYMKNTLPNEWYGTWHTEAIKAGAYCVKMVGIYRALRPVSSSGGYDVTQNTQKYIPNSQYSTTDEAIDSIKNYGMATTYGRLFFPEYAAGTKGSAGTKACGQLKQWGSQYLAQQGYTYKQILNYYYGGSEYCPSGDVMIFGYNIGY